MKKMNIFWDPVELINRLQTKTFKQEDLIPRQKRLIIKYFMEYKPEFSNVEIARLIDMSDMYVHNEKQEMLRQGASEIESIDVKIVAVSLKKRKEELQRRALTVGDIRLGWQIECDFIREMQNLGFINKAPEKIAIAGRLEMETETGLKKFFGEIGVMSVEQFVLNLGKLRAGGDGDGQDRSIEDRREVKGVLVAPGKPGISEG